MPRTRQLREIIVRIPYSKQEKVLDEAGYFPHHKGDGWIYGLVGKQRFHAHCDYVGIRLHRDKNFNNYHRLIVAPIPLIQEKKRLERIASGKKIQLIPVQVRAEKKKRKFKDATAPNLAIIQKEINNEPKT